MEKRYHVSYRKFARLYLLYPIVFYLTSMDASTGVMLGTIGVGSAAAMILSHLFFRRWVYDAWVVTLRDDELETFSMLGEKKQAKYKELAGPLTFKLGILTVFMYSQASGRNQYTVITDWIEHADDCLDRIEQKIEQHSAG